MKKIKIGYFADGPWSHEAFQLLIKDSSVQIEFIVPRTDSKDQTLFEFSQKYHIPYFKGVNINSDDFYNQVNSFEIDLFVSMSFNQIFKSRITNFPRLGTINCHAGKLPFYRGRNILNWVLINDEKEFGITVHFIDDGIDTGDIILQRCFPISDEDNYESLLQISYKECATILFDSIKKIQSNVFERIKQNSIHPVGFYCGLRSQGDEILNWNQSSRELFCFIRAICYPGPRATTYLNGNEVKINKSALIEGAPKYKSTIGQIVGKTQRGFVVKTNDSIIEIFEIESEIKLKIGDKLS
ncbi:methionyl-tRNA formyltransferase [Aquirufa nivalisilvae]